MTPSLHQPGFEPTLSGKTAPTPAIPIVGWRYERYVVTTPGAILPGGCIGCGTHENLSDVQLEVTFKHRTYAPAPDHVETIADDPVSKKVIIAFDRCRRCRQRVKRFEAPCNAAMGVGVSIIVADRAFLELGLSAVGGPLLLGGFILACINTEPLSGYFRDQHHLFIKGASNAYLQSLPQLPPDRVPPFIRQSDSVL